jgi:Zn-dependent protease with chaperone function
MFTPLIFLILVLLLSNFASEFQHPGWIADPWKAFGWGLLLYAAVLGLIALQNTLFSRFKKLLVLITHLELLAFLAVFLLLFNALSPLSDLFSTLVTLGLYLGGLAVFYATQRPRKSKEVALQMRLLIPFALPFLAFLGSLKFLETLPFPWVQEALQSVPFLILFSCVLFGLMTLLFPPLIVRIWGCQPMQTSPLKARLEALCARADFKHAGMLDWTLLNRSHTAAILGVIPRFRYVLFTKRLQEDLSPEALEAVLAHEIGHNDRHHLLLMPLILLGLFLCLWSYTLWGTPLFEYAFASHPLFYPLALFLPYALILALYLRFVVGFFSRLFERQADLHCFETGIPAENMIQALDDVARATGFTHATPSWHHYSIQQRIDFLQTCIQDPTRIAQHHRKVDRALLIYGGLLIIGFFILLT